jgi:serine/threonine protein kinase
VAEGLGGDLGRPSTGFPGGSVPGMHVAGYRLERRVGQGGMAVVYQARDEHLGRLVALKVLAPELAADETFRQRFIRESRAAAAVDDPHILPVFAAGKSDGVLYIAMRYVPGGDLRTMVSKDGRFSPGQTAAVITQVASALDAAHAAGLVHRDVKPANMLIDARADRTGHVYLSDFGLSKTALGATAGLTRTGQFLGSLNYVAPEQIEGNRTDGRADQYALACTAFELLTGAPPFQRQETTAAIYAHLSAPPPVTSRRPELPSAADPAFARALAKVPDSRYRSCTEFADALAEAIGTTAQYVRSRPGPSPDHPETEVNWPARHDVARAGPSAKDAYGRTVTAAHSLNEQPADGGTAVRALADARTSESGPTPTKGRAWTRDWTAWALIAFLPATIFGVVGLNYAMGKVGYGIGGTVLTLAWLAALVAVITKLVRMLRRWHQRRKRTSN